MKRIKKSLALVFSLVLVLNVFTMLGGKTDKVYAATFEKDATNTALGTSKIAAPDSGAGNWSYVYYGKYKYINDLQAVKYRVLAPSTTDFGGNTLLLDCDSALIPDKKYHTSYEEEWDDNKDKLWVDSDIKIELNGENFLGDGDYFKSAEKNAIALSTKASATRTIPDTTYLPLSNDKVFILSADELCNTSYGYGEEEYDNLRNKSRFMVNSDYQFYWVRSYQQGQSNVATRVRDDSKFAYDYISYNTYLSPAFNVDLSKIIFSSAVSGNMGAKGTTYKLTLKDENIKIGVTEGQEATIEGKTVTVPFTASVTGGSEANRLSYLVTKGDYQAEGSEIKAYGKLTEDYTTNGTGTITLPDNYDASTDKIYILAELVLGQEETDYAAITEINPKKENAPAETEPTQNNKTTPAVDNGDPAEQVLDAEFEPISPAPITKSPSTADNANPLLYVFVILAAIGIMGYSVKVFKR